MAKDCFGSPKKNIPVKRKKDKLVEMKIVINKARYFLQIKLANEHNFDKFYVHSKLICRTKRLCQQVCQQEFKRSFFLHWDGQAGNSWKESKLVCKNILQVESYLTSIFFWNKQNIVGGNFIKAEKYQRSHQKFNK